MFLKQYYLGCLAHASYMVADPETKQAAVIDPQRDIEQYLEDAKEHGFSIKYVILTHFHADFIAGHIELRNQAGARIVIGHRAPAEFEVLAAHDGDALDLGNVLLTIMETPGHTPEGISILVYDRLKAPDVPHAVLTGDTLFIGDVGRPDLLASIGVTADELADMLYDSIGRLSRLPDSTLVYPAHGAGSLCGKQLSSESVSTIGEQKRVNYAMQPMSREAFKQLVTEDQPDAPAYFVYDAIKNRQERGDLTETMHQARQAMSLEEIMKAQEAGAQLLDVRAAADFESAHLPNSLNIDLNGQYATWCGTLLHQERPIIVIGETGNEDEAIMRLGRIGFDHVVGYLAGGIESLAQRPEVLRAIPRVTAQAVADLMSGDHPPVILDVRTDKERRVDQIANSLHVPLSQLSDRWSEVPTDRSVVVHCEGGYRSAIAASLLAQHGYQNLSDLVGGIKAWRASQLPLVTPSDTVPACS